MKQTVVREDEKETTKARREATREKERETQQENLYETSGAAALLLPLLCTAAAKASAFVLYSSAWQLACQSSRTVCLCHPRLMTEEERRRCLWCKREGQRQAIPFTQAASLHVSRRGNKRKKNRRDAAVAVQTQIHPPSLDVN